MAWQQSFDAPQPEAPVAMPFETPGESFPGSAFYYLDDSGYRPMPLEDEVHSDAAPSTATKVPGDDIGPAARAHAARWAATATLPGRRSA